MPEPWLSQYKGRYDAGYEPIAAARLARLKQLGLIPGNFAAAPAAPETLVRSPASPNYGSSAAKYINALNGPDKGYVDFPAGYVNKKWASLSSAERKVQARYMEIYAGMVSNLDHNVGLLIQHLKDIGEYDNTFIMFQSDNGAEGWPNASGADPKAGDEANAVDTVFATLGTDNGKQAVPRLQYGLRWAEVSATPLSQLKGAQGEGGIGVPAIVHLPGQVGQRAHFTQFTHVIDNTATFLELAGITPPATPAPADIDARTGVDKNRGKVIHQGRQVYPLTGKSLLASLQDKRNTPLRDQPFGGESYGRAFILSADGQWKARWTEPPHGPADGRWELFNIATDRAETRDLSAQYPTLVQQLFQQWKDYMSSVGGVEPARPAAYY